MLLNVLKLKFLAYDPHLVFTFSSEIDFDKRVPADMLINHSLSQKKNRLMKMILLSKLLRNPNSLMRSKRQMEWLYSPIKCEWLLMKSCDYFLWFS